MLYNGIFIGVMKLSRDSSGCIATDDTKIYVLTNTGVTQFAD